MKEYLRRRHFREDWSQLNDNLRALLIRYHPINQGHIYITLEFDGEVWRVFDHSPCLHTEVKELEDKNLDKAKENAERYIANLYAKSDAQIGIGNKRFHIRNENLCRVGAKAVWTSNYAPDIDQVQFYLEAEKHDVEIGREITINKTTYEVIRKQVIPYKIWNNWKIILDVKRKD